MYQYGSDCSDTVKDIAPVRLDGNSLDKEDAYSKATSETMAGGDLYTIESYKLVLSE
jgi:hypothetical protein